MAHAIALTVCGWIDLARSLRGPARSLCPARLSLLAPAGLLLCLFPLGCRQLIIDDIDRTVYGAIERRQQDALGFTTDVRVIDETGKISQADENYAFVPHPLERDLPDSFQEATPGSAGDGKTEAESDPETGAPPRDDTAMPAESSGTPPESPDAKPESGDVDSDSADADKADSDSEDDDGLIGKGVFTDQDLARLKVFDLSDVLAFAMRHGRDLQNAKEDLYIAGLDLTLERHLWTPQFVASVRADFADFGQTRDFDRAMTTVSDVSVSQRLPYGGQVTARMINTLMRDLGRRVTSGESGTAILDANIPLFRGAGRVAYESRYQSERDLIYAVRIYERFRRSFLVNVASDYFNLQQLKAEIDNVYQSYLSRRKLWRKAEFTTKVGRSRDVFDAARASSNLRLSEADLVSAKERYASALDRFKIVIGMSMDTPLDVVSQAEDEDSNAVEDLLPDVSEAAAIEVALRFRLDLLTSTDRIGDMERGAIVARNRVLPDLDFTGSVTMNTDPAQKNALSFNTERTTWRGGLELRMDDRWTERNAFRSSLISVRRARRDYDQFRDTVVADVRRALRRIVQQDDLRQIQAMTVEENARRAAAARAKFDRGDASNQDVVDADNEELAGRNNLARAVANYRFSILQFRLDTGTLRITDEGHWGTPGVLEPAGSGD